MSEWTNDDGLKVRFGGTNVSVDRGSETNTDGFEREFTIVFDYAQANATIEGTDAAGDGSYGYIPSGARLIDADLTILEAFATGTGINIGLDELDGTAIDEDGFFASGAGGALANLTPAGSVLSAATTILGDTLTADAYPYIAWVGTAATAGKARLRVRYSV